MSANKVFSKYGEAPAGAGVTIGSIYAASNWTFYISFVTIFALQEMTKISTNGKQLRCFRVGAIMDFSGIQKNVHDIWSFVWPPTLIIIVAAAIAYYLAKEYASSLQSRISAAPRGTWFSPNVYRTLKRLDLIKLIPFTLVFFVFFTLYLVSVVTDGFGNVLPGNVTWENARLLTSTYNNDELARTWANSFPDIADVDKLALAIDQRIVAPAGSSDSPAFSNVSNWDQKVGSASSSLRTVKVLLFWSLVCIIPGIRYSHRKTRRFGRWVLCVFVLLGFEMYYVAEMVYDLEQLGYAKSAAAQVTVTKSVDAKPTKPAELEKKVRECREKITHFATKTEFTKDWGSVGIGWWQFRLLESNYFTWFTRTFLGNSRRATDSVVGRARPLNRLA